MPVHEHSVPEEKKESALDEFSSDSESDGDEVFALDFCFNFCLFYFEL